MLSICTQVFWLSPQESPKLSLGVALSWLGWREYASFHGGAVRV